MRKSFAGGRYSEIQRENSEIQREIPGDDEGHYGTLVVAGLTLVTTRCGWSEVCRCVAADEVDVR